MFTLYYFILFYYYCYVYDIYTSTVTVVSTCFTIPNGVNDTLISTSFLFVLLLNTSTLKFVSSPSLSRMRPCCAREPSSRSIASCAFERVLSLLIRPRIESPTCLMIRITRSVIRRAKKLAATVPDSLKLVARLPLTRTEPSLLTGIRSSLRRSLASVLFSDCSRELNPSMTSL